MGTNIRAAGHRVGHLRGGGSVIAPRLAEALGLPFVDRLISADMSQDAAQRERTSAAASLRRASSEEEQAATPQPGASSATSPGPPASGP